MKRATTEKEKIECLAKINGTVSAAERETKIVSRDKTWLIQTADPVLNCLKFHFDDDMDKFIDKWKTRDFENKKTM